MKVIIDAMGGDNAPAEIVKGAVAAMREFGVELIFTGREADIRTCLGAEGVTLPNAAIEIVHTTEVIDMEDDPSTATRRKKDSSMSVGLRLLREGKGDAMISAGSTGALLTGATLTVKRISGIRRAALAPVLPNGGRGVVLIDCGANVECTAEYLLQFAYMGSFYSQHILGCEKPRVGLLNVGVEETKGGELQKQAHFMLQKAHEEGRIHFIGNVEARELLLGSVDVLVTDGFSGNVLLKSLEGCITFILQTLKGVFLKSTKNKLAAALLKSDFQEMRKGLDVAEVGGTALLGISRPVIKAHGSSDARAIRSAVKQAMAFVDANIIGEIERNIEYMKTSAN